MEWFNTLWYNVDSMFRCFYFFNKNESNRLRSELQTSDWPVRDGSSTVYLKDVCCFNTNLTSDHILGETSPVSVSNVGSVAKFEFKSKDISRVFVAEPLHKPLQGGWLSSWRLLVGLQTSLTPQAPVLDNFSSISVVLILLLFQYKWTYTQTKSQRP